MTVSSDRDYLDEQWKAWLYWHADPDVTSNDEFFAFLRAWTADSSGVRSAFLDSWESRDA